MPSKREPTYRRAQRLKRKELAAAKAKRRIKQAETSVVYFIRFPPSEMIKVGVTVDLTQRMRTFRTVAVPEILAVTPGGYLLERELHQRFDHLRTRGEFFSPDPELLALIDSINEGTFVDTGLDQSDS